MKKLSTILLLFVLVSCAAQPGFKLQTNNGKALTNGNKKKLVLTTPAVITSPPPTDTTTVSFPSIADGGAVAIPAALTTYYFSESLGDNSRTSTQAQSPSTPWRTTAALQGRTINAGTHLRFMDGNYGPAMTSFNLVPMVLAINSDQGWQGTSANPIVVEAAPGAHPVFTTLQSVSSPTSLAGSGYSNVWAYTVNPWEEITSVYIDGVLTPVTAFPKRNASGKGTWLMGKSGTGHGYRNTDTMTTSSANVPAHNIVGADIVFRNSQFVLTANKIVGQSSTKIAFYTSSEVSVDEDKGFFYENHPSFLTQNREWAYDRSTGKLDVYFADNTPANHTVQVSTTNYTVWQLNGKHIIFDGISFKGANVYGITIQNSDGLVVQNCSFEGMGRGAIWQVNGAANTIVYNNTIKNCYATAVDLGTEPGCRVEKNTIDSISMFAGAQRWTYNAGDNGAGKIINFVEATNGGGAIINAGDNSFVRSNRIQYTGYNGIVINGTNAICTYNYLNQFMCNTGDGGGIYSFGAGISGRFNSSNKRLIAYNILIAGPGDAGGTPDTSFYQIYCVYLDDESVWWRVTNNTFSGAKHAAFYTHHTQNITASDNVIYDSKYAFFTRYGDNASNMLPVKDSIINNVIVSAQSGQTDSTLTVVNQGVFASLTPAQTAVFSGNRYYGFDASKQLALIYNTTTTTSSIAYTGGPYNNILTNALLGVSPLSLGAFQCVIGFKTVSPP